MANATHAAQVAERQMHDRLARAFAACYVAVKLGLPFGDVYRQYQNKPVGDFWHRLASIAMRVCQ